ncbi:hypothetical protein [Azospirillum cavernae]|uniref:hypothetical protein n=1 Tax=Azospirillum cavernae TaxID=2320860 RepID=UPI0011C404BE|nr:hypothetical protein [Azospirillum cavernae]
MMGSIVGSVWRELRDHRRKNKDIMALSSGFGYNVCRLFTNKNWVVLPINFMLYTIISCIASVYIPLSLEESQAGTVKDIASYIISAQVTLVALAIPVIIAGAQLLLSARSVKGREFDLAILLDIGRPREITSSSLLLTAVMFSLFSWPHEIIAGPMLSGARPYILAIAGIWFLANLAGYVHFIHTALDLVSNEGRIRLRKRAIAWFGFDEEIGDNRLRDLWYEFRQELEASGLAGTWTVGWVPPLNESWFGFARAGRINDVRTTVLRIALRWLRFRNGDKSTVVGIAFYLGSDCKSGQHFLVDKRPDLIGRILLRSSLKIGGRASFGKSRFRPSALLEALGSDVEHQILTGTPADADAAFSELLDMLHVLLRASMTTNGNYATKNPMMSLLRNWVDPVHSLSWVAAGALQKSPEFASNIAVKLAQACRHAVTDRFPPEIVRVFAEAIGLLLYRVSRRSHEEGKIESIAHREFVKRGEWALGYPLNALYHGAEFDDPWRAFQQSAETRLIFVGFLASNVSYVAWVNDLYAARSYLTVFANYSKDIDASRAPIEWRRMPDDLWKKDRAEARTILSEYGSEDTAMANWRRQVLIDRLLLAQLVWAQWIAEGARTDDEWIKLVTRLSKIIRGDKYSIFRYFLSFGHIFRRFVAMCETTDQDDHETINEFVSSIDRVRDSDKEGFFYSDAVHRIKDLVPGLIIHALVTFDAQGMQGAVNEITEAKNSGMIDGQKAKEIFDSLHSISCDLPKGIVETLSPHFSDWTERLAALQVSLLACRRIFDSDR